MKRVSAVWAIIRKDSTAWTRSRFLAVITILGLGAYIGIFWLMPQTVNETVEVGVHGSGIEAALEALAEAGGGEGQGLALATYETTDALQSAVETDDGPAAGIDFPDDFLTSVAAGKPTTVRVFVRADTTPEVEAAMSSMVRELAYEIAGDLPPVSVPSQEEIILGPDYAGNQVSLRDKMRPLLAVFALMLEMFSLAALVAEEIRSKTVTAILATPASVADFLTAKTLFGTFLAFAEVGILMVAVKGFGEQPLVTVTALLLASLLITGFALLAGSTGKDFVEILFWSMMFMIPMMIPAGAALFPGTITPWVRVLPTYGMTEAIVKASSYGAGWSETGGFLLMTLGWTVVAFGLGVFVLKRRVESL